MSTLAKGETTGFLNLSFVNLSTITNNTKADVVQRDETVARIEVAVLATIFTLTVIGNTIVLVALVVRRIKMTRMYYFLQHLCISDLITAFFHVLPQLAWDVTYRFYGGNVLCKIVKYMQILGPYLSSYVLLVTAIDRYQAICFPLTSCVWTPRKSKIMIANAWIISILCCFPQIFIFSYQKVSEDPVTFDCWGIFIQPWGEKVYVLWYAVSQFFIPLVVIAFTYIRICKSVWYNLQMRRQASNCETFTVPRSHCMRGLSRSKVKTFKITVVVITCYIICSTPFIIVQLWAYWSPNAKNSSIWKGPTVAILMLLASLNSCVNPWIYLAFNYNLVTALREVCCQTSSKSFSSQVPENTDNNTFSRSERCSSYPLSVRTGSRHKFPDGSTTRTRKRLCRELGSKNESTDVGENRGSVTQTETTSEPGKFVTRDKDKTLC
ncbi:oxytocin receptor-like [Limulus polyphemus]|uniref:Oxytocin receptor-like n=1 Tax=Limulus polyphemus TaxID=6850 RepID=A0ABM1BL01_LIMPO|nr:oxytocin receptor-like [Limulus polyphemus]